MARMMILKTVCSRIQTLLAAQPRKLARLHRAKPELSQFHIALRRSWRNQQFLCQLAHRRS